MGEDAYGAKVAHVHLGGTRSPKGTTPPLCKTPRTRTQRVNTNPVTRSRRPVEAGQCGLLRNKELCPGRQESRTGTSAENKEPSRPSTCPTPAFLRIMPTVLSDTAVPDVFRVSSDTPVGAALSVLAGSADVPAFAFDTILLSFSFFQSAQVDRKVLGLALDVRTRAAAVAWADTHAASFSPPTSAPAALALFAHVARSAPFALDGLPVLDLAVTVEGNRDRAGDAAFAADLRCSSLDVTGGLSAASVVRSAVAALAKYVLPQED